MIHSFNLRRTAMVCAGLVALATSAHAGILDKAVGEAMSGHGKGPVYFERQASFKGANQVVLGQFSVAYFTRKVDFVGGGFLSQGSAKTTGTLTGLSEADYQAMTDSIYADFKAKLAASGVMIVDPTAYYASKYYQKVKSEPQGQRVLVPLQDDDKADAIAYWPTELARHDNMGFVLRIFDGNLRDTYTAQYDYARTAKIPVLNVMFVVDFAGPSSTEGGGLFQSVKVTSQLAISNRGSQIQLMDTTGKVGRIVLNQALVEGGDFAEITDVTSKFNKAAESAQLIGGALLAGGGISGKLGSLTKGQQMSRSFAYKVTDAKRFDDLTIHAGNLATDVFVQQLTGIR